MKMKIVDPSLLDSSIEAIFQGVVFRSKAVQLAAF